MRRVVLGEIVFRRIISSQFNPPTIPKNDQFARTQNSPPVWFQYCPEIAYSHLHTSLISGPPAVFTHQQGFLTGPLPDGAHETVRANGDVVRYNPATDEFGVVTPNGVIRTYYKPDPAIHGYPTNEDYFNDQ